MNLVDRVGNTRGRFTDKDNRVARLIYDWDNLMGKMERMITRGRTTETARLAYAVLTMMETGIRVGNEGSAEGYRCENKYLPEFGQIVQTYGLTTLQHRHVKHKGKFLILSFTGKKGVGQNLIISNPILLKYCPGPNSPKDKKDLWLGVTYPELYKFVKKYIGKKYKPKDIRAAKVNLHFCEGWSKRADEFLQQTTKSACKKIVREALVETAEHIGHTLGVCRSAYMSKNVLAFLSTFPVKE